MTNPFQISVSRNLSVQKSLVANSINSNTVNANVLNAPIINAGAIDTPGILTSSIVIPSNNYIQHTSQNTTVPTAGMSGTITTVLLAFNQYTTATFLVTNDYVKSTSLIQLTSNLATSAQGTPLCWVSTVTDGSYKITVANVHYMVSFNSPITINYLIINA